MLTVFDLDGTLIDSRRDLADSANQLIDEYGGRTLPVDEIARMVGEGARLLVHRALAAAGLPADDPRAVARFLAIYDTRLLNHTRPYPGIDAALNAAAVHGAVALLTNKPQHHTERILSGLGLTERFDEVIGGDSPFGRKPEPAGLQHLVEAHGAARDTTVMVGDSPTDLRTGRAAGVSVCVARYGFGFRLFGADEPFEGVAIIDRPPELVNVLAAMDSHRIADLGLRDAD